MINFIQFSPYLFLIFGLKSGIFLLILLIFLFQILGLKGWQFAPWHQFWSSIFTRILLEYHVWNFTNFIKIFLFQILGLKGNNLPPEGIMATYSEVNGTRKLLEFMLDNLHGRKTILFHNFIISRDIKQLIALNLSY